MSGYAIEERVDEYIENRTETGVWRAKVHCLAHPLAPLG
jgi:hypothetical protein